MSFSLADHTDVAVYLTGRTLSLWCQARCTFSV